MAAESKYLCPASYFNFLVMLPFKPITDQSKLFKQVIIDRIIEETPTVKTFVIRPLAGEIVYLAGQFLTFVFQTQSTISRRSYSISSALDEPLSVTVKRLTNGAFSRPLLESAKPGDQLTMVGKASGFFVLPKNLEAYGQVIFLAAGSGITPIYSLIKSLLANNPGVSVVLIYSNTSPEKAIFRNGLLSLAAKYSEKFQIEWLFSNRQDLWKARLNKLVLEKLLRQHRTTSNQMTLAYLCGPFNYMRMAAIVLQSDGIPLSNIRREVFTPETPTSLLQPPDILPHKVSIAIGGRTHQLIVQHPESILSAARKYGLELPYSCESGRCGSCVAKRTSGNTWMKFNEVLTDNEVDQGRVLTCSAFPVGGDVTIQFD